MTQSALEQNDLVTALSTTDYGNRFEDDEKRGQRSPHTGRFTRHSDYGSDEFLNIKFTAEKVFSKRDTYLNGGKPTYIDQDFITITSPGDKNTVIHTHVTDFYQWRFPFEYEAFKNGNATSVIGTPIDEFDELVPEQVADLKHAGIHTVEQLAEISDSNNSILRSFFATKARAKTWLANRKSSESNKAVKELEAKLEQRDKQLDDLTRRLEQVLVMVEGKQKTKG